MMAAARAVPLIERLPPVRGRLTAGAPLAGITWFGVGGPAEVMFRPLDEADLADFLAALPADVAVTVIGVGSNLLVRDGGISGIVIRLGRGFATIEPDCPRIRVGAAALDVNVATLAAEAGIAGCEFLSGVPGTIGGALRMNAGAYGGDMAQAVVSARALDRRGQAHDLDAAALGFSYRRSAVREDWIFVAALLEGRADDPATIKRRLAAIRAEREASQPLRTKTGGSTFKNPTENNPSGAKAWQLIDQAGCRGLTRGGAKVSEQHCNFLINAGGASAADIEELGEEVRRRVFDRTGITLEWEIRRVGETA
ncbi:MAG TPA: UDP-N-acetylmuramate dehydrogenase [Candidatus Sulfotelmatobacter sp.]|nr:UDP-N-acetylmuramate dehydrogenase [Candidatus Sulfotelmatobacter sp.]